MLGNNSCTSTALSNQVQDLGPRAVVTIPHGKAPAHPGTGAGGHKSCDSDITAGPMSRRLFDSL